MISEVDRFLFTVSSLIIITMCAKTYSNVYEFAKIRYKLHVLLIKFFWEII